MKPSPDSEAPPARILIVDDNPDNRELLEIIFSRAGYVVLTAASGEEALAMVAKQAPDLILLDILMPEMDGCQVARELKGALATKHIVIVMLSGLDDHATRLRARTAGADAFVPKPLNRTELCLQVEQLLRLSE